ncbi:hypothetical protein AOQ72_07925 [Bradyrhizobium yuanmingense]|uniref:Uncharacterized protein n=1 Tax=Bradyrhizobium yuanmingense TaxID=108015 RepID=A0A0R3D1R4_9BRAD|nr:hypothetical protein [Bradyrhizobium yuanmingense]KRQ01397.1 hypothetical protein AOQ72_07925 [Bradyrhizobium yuanmingense]
MNKTNGLRPDDFPIEADKDRLKTHKGEPVASAETEQIADEIADRLNEQAHREEQDRWSA